MWWNTSAFSPSPRGPNTTEWAPNWLRDSSPPKAGSFEGGPCSFSSTIRETQWLWTWTSSWIQKQLNTTTRTVPVFGTDSAQNTKFQNPPTRKQQHWAQCTAERPIRELVQWPKRRAFSVRATMPSHSMPIGTGWNPMWIDAECLSSWWIDAEPVTMWKSCRSLIML